MADPNDVLWLVDTGYPGPDTAVNQATTTIFEGSDPATWSSPS